MIFKENKKQIELERARIEEKYRERKERRSLERLRQVISNANSI